MRGLILALIFSGQIFAAEIDPSSQKALDQTKTLLVDKNQRTQAIQGNESAQKNDSQIKSYSYPCRFSACIETSCQLADASYRFAGSTTCE